MMTMYARYIRWRLEPSDTTEGATAPAVDPPPDGGINQRIAESLVTQSENTNYGKGCPKNISDKPSAKECDRWGNYQKSYWRKCGIVDDDRNVDETRFHDAMQELEDFGLTADQFLKMQRAMVTDNVNTTPDDKFTPFTFNVSWLVDWIKEALVDRNDLYRKLYKMRDNKPAKKTLVDIFEETMDQAEDTFNDALIVPIYNTGDVRSNSTEGHVAGLNTLFGIVEFAKKSEVKNAGVDVKLKAELEPYILTNFANFKRTDFVRKLKTWSQIVNKAGGTKRIATTDNNTNGYKKKLAKAIAELKCVYCQDEECLIERQRICAKKKTTLCTVKYSNIKK
jgi:hypothetical protein